MPNTDRVLVDTHVLLWWQAGGERLSSEARSAIDSAETVLVNPISAWEIGMLIDKRRVQLDVPLLHWIDMLFRTRGIESVDLSPLIAGQASLLDRFHGDPADRLIYASAWFCGCPLITKDADIHAFAAEHGEVMAIW